MDSWNPVKILEHSKTLSSSYKRTAIVKARQFSVSPLHNLYLPYPLVFTIKRLIISTWWLEFRTFLHRWSWQRRQTPKSFIGQKPSMSLRNGKDGWWKQTKRSGELTDDRMQDRRTIACDGSQKAASARARSQSQCKPEPEARARSQSQKPESEQARARSQSQSQSLHNHLRGRLFRFKTLDSKLR